MQESRGQEMAKNNVLKVTMPDDVITGRVFQIFLSLDPAVNFPPEINSTGVQF